MEPALKQRLLGAAVLVALAVTFLPLLVMDPAPDSGASRVPLKVPPAPEAAGDMRTLDLPLAPAPAASAPPPAVDAAPAAPAAPPAAQAMPDAPPPTSPATAAGDYAVHFGSYATPADAARVVGSLKAAGLPAYQEPSMLGARQVHRVRIGPYPTAADAEAARLAAGRVRADVKARVVVLDADTAGRASTAATPASVSPTPATGAAASPAAPTPAKAAAAPAPAPPATTVAAGLDRPTPAGGPPPQPATPPAPASATRAPAAAGVGFAVQLGAFAHADEATRLRDRARAAGFAAFVEQVQTDRGALHRVRVGPVPDRAAADALRGQVAGRLGVSGIVRPHP